MMPDAGPNAGADAGPSRYLAAVAGRALDRPPVWLMRQAGRYLPEYRALRSNIGFAEAISNPDVAAELTLQPLQRFPLDAAIIFADIMTPLAAMGVSVTFDPGPNLARPIRKPADLGTFDLEHVRPTLDALKLVRCELPASTAVIGFCGAPFTLAAYLAEGHGSKDFPTVRAMLADPKSDITALLATLADAMGDYLCAQLDAGADAVQVFDSWVGLVSRQTYKSLIVPQLERLVARMDGRGPLIYFAPSATHLLELIGALPVDVVGVDWRLPITEAWQRLCRRNDIRVRHPSSRRCIQGNLDPATLLAGPGPTAAATYALLDLVAGTPGHVVNVGHGLMPQTPLDSVSALVETVVEWPEQTGELNITEAWP